MTNKRVIRKTYFTRNIGDYLDDISFLGKKYSKLEDLRYGTNPHQTAAFYKPTSNDLGVLSEMKILKTGKSGLSETNIEDISYAINILKYFNKTGAAIMKHLNPSGAAMQYGDETLLEIYRKARDCDSRAFFGGVVVFNVEVDVLTAEEIMGSYIEVVVAPGFSQETLSVFEDFDRFKLNKNIRVIQVSNIDRLPKYVGDETHGIKQVRLLNDGTLIISDILLTNIRNVDDFTIAEVTSKKKGQIRSTISATQNQKEDLLFAWHVMLNVRSNCVVIAKNKSTLGIGTGEQDRVGAAEQAIDKYKKKYKGKESIQDSVLVTDGYCPFPDVVEIAADAGVSAVAFPAGSVKDFEVVKAGNDRNVAVLFAPERCFSHH
jgi:AICAR transformylase/IMP cyclohydrolase PurH